MFFHNDLIIHITEQTTIFKLYKKQHKENAQQLLELNNAEAGLMLSPESILRPLPTLSNFCAKIISQEKNELLQYVCIIIETTIVPPKEQYQTICLYYLLLTQKNKLLLRGIFFKNPETLIVSENILSSMTPPYPVKPYNIIRTFIVIFLINIGLATTIKHYFSKNNVLTTLSQAKEQDAAKLLSELNLLKKKKLSTHLIDAHKTQYNYQKNCALASLLYGACTTLPPDHALTSIAFDTHATNSTYKILLTGEAPNAASLSLFEEKFVQSTTHMQTIISSSSSFIEQKNNLLFSLSIIFSTSFKNLSS